MEDIVAELPRLIAEVTICVGRGAPAQEAHIWPDGACGTTGLPGVWFNGAIIHDGPDPERRLRETVRLFNERGVAAMVLIAADVAARVEPVARELGLQSAGLHPWMAYKPDRSQPGGPTDTRYEITQVRDESGLGDVCTIASACFEIPLDLVKRAYGPPLLGALGLRIFVARADGEAVSTVMTTEGGATVGIWTMATRPERQRRGAGRALLDHVLDFHVAHGARRFYLGATEEGRRLYESAGFRTVTELPVWIVEGEQSAAH